MPLLTTNPYLLAGLCGTLFLSLFLLIYRLLLPVPLPCIPHNASSRSRIFGDGPLLKSRAKQWQTHDFSRVVFSITRDLKTPIAQMLITSFVGPYVLVNDPREVEDILVRRNREFDRSELTANFFSPMLPRSTIAQLTTPALKVQKRLWADVMGAEFLRRVVAGGVLGCVRELVALWRIKAQDGDGDGLFDPAHDFECAALDAIWTAVLGSKIGVVRREIGKVRKREEGGESVDDAGLESAAIIQKAMAYMNELVSSGHQSTFPVLSSLRLQLTPSYRRFMGTVNQELSRLMAQSCERFERIQTTGTAPTDDAGQELDTCAMDLVLRREILTARKKAQSGATAAQKKSDPTKDPAMLQELLLLLLGGHDSTTNTLCWFVKFAGMYAESQIELRETLRSALGINASNRSDNWLGELTGAQLVSMDIPYLDAYVEEVVRFSTTAGMITRKAVVDTTILGYRVPKGTHVILSTRVDETHSPAAAAAVSGGKVQARVEEKMRSASSRGAQEKRTRGGLEGESGRSLGKFEPRRWLARNEATGKDVFDGNALPTLTFGGGLRGCFGKRLAYMELRIMIAILILSFEFLPLDNEALNSMDAEERIFRRPTVCQVKLRVL